MIGIRGVLIVFENFKSKVLSSFRRIKKDMSLIAKTNKNLSRDLKRFSKKVLSIDSIKRDNLELEKKLVVHSKILQKIAKQKYAADIQMQGKGFFSHAAGSAKISSKINSLHSELKTEIEGLKYELSKSSENSYQAYSDSIIVQREMDYLKKENRILRDELTKKQDALSNELSIRLKDISKLHDAVNKLSENVAELKRTREKQAVEGVEIKTRAQRHPQITIVDNTSKSENAANSDHLRQITRELDFLKSRLNVVEMNSSDKAPLFSSSVSSHVPSQKTIFSFNKIKPLVKMFARKEKKSKKKITVDYSNDSFERNNASSASMTYMPQAWSKISGYKKVDKKKSSYSW